MSTLDNRVTSLLAKPSLEGLAYALRHKEVWPDRFKWNYDTCTTCAMGLANRLWSMRLRDGAFNYIEGTARQFKMNPDLAFTIFYSLGRSGQTITPEHVADAIDAYLAQRV